MTLAKQAGIVLCAATFLFSAASFRGQDTIGAHPDGVTYTVDGSSTVTKPDSRDCGFNDIGAANMGSFRRESRTYQEYKDGQMVRQWGETDDVFLGCIEP